MSPAASACGIAPAAVALPASESAVVGTGDHEPA